MIWSRLLAVSTVLRYLDKSTTCFNIDTYTSTGGNRIFIITVHFLYNLLTAYNACNDAACGNYAPNAASLAPDARGRCEHLGPGLL